MGHREGPGPGRQSLPAWLRGRWDPGAGHRWDPTSVSGRVEVPGVGEAEGAGQEPHQRRMGQSRKAGDQGAGDKGGHQLRATAPSQPGGIGGWGQSAQGGGQGSPGRGTGKPSPGTESCCICLELASWGGAVARTSKAQWAPAWALDSVPGFGPPSGALAARPPGDPGWGVSPQTRGA